MKDILGLMVLSWPLVLMVVIGITFFVSVPLAIRYAKKHERSKWSWGIGTFAVLFLLIFWDWIPTVVAHKYYCSTEAGFWIYKTVDQWKAENPGVVETLVANTQVVTIQNAYVLNQRFNWIIKQRPFFPLNYAIREEQQVVDSKNGEVLARYVDFSVSHERRRAGWAGWKLWLDSPHCSGGGRDENLMRQFKNSFRGVEK